MLKKIFILLSCALIFAAPNLAMAIENEFEITLSPNDITDMLSYKLIKQILLEKFK